MYLFAYVLIQINLSPKEIFSCYIYENITIHRCHPGRYNQIQAYCIGFSKYKCIMQHLAWIIPSNKRTVSNYAFIRFCFLHCVAWKVSQYQDLFLLSIVSIYNCMSSRKQVIYHPQFTQSHQNPSWISCFTVALFKLVLHITFCYWNISDSAQSVSHFPITLDKIIYSPLLAIAHVTYVASVKALL